ncbi:MAG: DUF547 domain-containing protein, partial [Deferrisomatales bacterium]|nr:DUF547 domain-containing protein [Deferrisomatales bacterium]
MTRTHRFLLLAAVPLLAAAAASAAPKPDLWPRWEAHAPESTATVNHEAWETFLSKYLVTGHPSGVNRVGYADVSAEDKAALDRYVASLGATPVSKLSRPEQLAYWINFYNALTVKVILDHHPVESIRDIKSGWFSPGPWELKLATVEREALTLNDIEHRILRPIFGDNRVHYAVNCASIGCPNLQPEAFTAENTEELLERGAREYINHPRGARMEGEKLIASSIYDWFQVDFGGSEEGVLRHLRRYAEGELAGALRNFGGKVSYGYDW